MDANDDPALYQSRPVDISNPSWDSLLDALRVVHEGTMPPMVLTLYHEALLKEWTRFDAEVKARLASDPQAEDLRMTMGSLAISKISLDALPVYVKEPTAEHMAWCVQTLMNAIRINKDVRLFLSGNT